MPKLQNEDFKSSSELIAAGGNSSQLLNDTKIYVTGKSLNKTLYDTINQGLLGGSGSGKNYIVLKDFENNSTAGWSLGTTGTLTNGIPTGTPTFGSGAAGTLSISIVSSGNQLAGSYSLSYASGNATTVGNMLATDALTIDKEDQAKVLSFKFYYSVPVNPDLGNFSGTSSNSFGVAIWDVTNSSWIGVSGQFSMVQSYGVGIAQGTFQTNSNTSSLRLVVYNANATSGAITLYFDDFFLGPQPVLIAPAMSDWQSYTPAFTSFGTVTVQDFIYRRLGDSIEIIGKFTSGTSVASEARLSLPSGLSIDGTKVLSIKKVGEGCYVATNTANQIQILAEPNVTYFTFGNQSSTTSGVTKVNANTIAGSGDALSIKMRVPIAGWSSNAVSSADTDTRVCVATAGSSEPDAVSLNSSVVSVMAWKSTGVDTHAGITLSSGSFTASTGQWTVNPKYTAPISGYYKITASVVRNFTANNVSNTHQIYIFKNGSSVSNLTRNEDANNNSGLNFSFQIIDEILKLNANDYIDIRVSSDTSNGVTSAYMNHISIQLISGPAVVQASESVNASYALNSAQSCANNTNTIIKFTTFYYDSHSAYNTSTGIYTFPISGKYRISASIMWDTVAWTTSSSSNNAYLRVNYNNGSKYFQISEKRPWTGEPFVSHIGSITVSGFAGDTIKLEMFQNSGGSLSLIAASPENYFMIERIGY